VSVVREPLRMAVLDDYQNVAVSMADWSSLDGRVAITFFNDHLRDADAIVARLRPFRIVNRRFYQDTVENVTKWLDAEAASTPGRGR
jgi:hypothetical protein